RRCWRMPTSTPCPFRLWRTYLNRLRAPSLAVALFLERITSQVVAVHLPEAWLVLVHELQATHPLRGLPEVQVRHHQAHWPAVLASQYLAVVVCREQVLRANEVVQEQVCRVAAVSVDHDRCRFRLQLYKLHDLFDG